MSEPVAVPDLGPLTDLDFMDEGHWVGTVEFLGVPFSACFFAVHVSEAGEVTPSKKLSDSRAKEAWDLLELTHPDDEPKLVRLPEVEGLFYCVISPFAAS